jgi:Carboxypeptidase regulatory-like domain
MTRMLARAGMLVVLVAAALEIVACTHADGQSGGVPSSYGTLTGRVIRGPTLPVGGPGISPPPSPPVAGADLKIVDSKGVVVATARTAGDGHYRVAVPPGQYRVERGASFSGVTKNLPSLVAISPGQETRLDVLVDTGIR